MYKERCKKLIDMAGCPCLITSDENVFYFSGFTGEDSFLYISSDYLGLFTDGRFTIQGKEEAPDFDLIDTEKNKRIEAVLKDVPLLGIEDNNMTVRQFARYSAMTKPCPVSSHIEEIRKVKSPSEIEKIASAQAISEAAFSNFLENFTPGMTELDCAFMLEAYMRKEGAFSVSFPTICASGKNGAKPHHTATKKEILKGELMVMDFGCVLDGYSSDMTRTVAYGPVSHKAKEVYDVVLSAHKSAFSSMKAGVLAGDVDKAAREIIENAGFGREFCHSLGHGVGLAVHESPYARCGSHEVLKEGMTLTCEPGIYIPDEFGVRIEDLCVIEKNGAKSLNSLTKELICL